MSVIGDISDLVKQFPGLKALIGLPERVKVLEARLAEVESQLQARPAAEACPICGGPMKVTKSTPHPTFGEVGLHERTLTCQSSACGHTEARMHDPANLTKAR